MLSMGENLMRAVDLITKKRNGEELSSDELKFLVHGFVNGSIPDYQISAFLMSVFFQGMTFPEIGNLTRLMMHSGDTFDLSSVGAFTVDKHSTGGVGDKVSLILAPLVASAGVPVPMVSGRGLGHTGGTLDKLEAIPGYNTRLDERRFVEQIKKIGVAIIGQTDNFVPADKKLYALRDVTATVESIPLISASIVSKKAASGTDGFIFDVKTGTGAFMSTLENARKLALSLIGIMDELGKKSMALITDMNQPLGWAVGNSIEVLECVDIMKNKGPADLRKICLKLGARMLVLGDKSTDIDEAEKILDDKLVSGDALDKFREMLEAQGGNPAIIDDYSLMDVAPEKVEIPSLKDGYVESFNTREIGIASMLLGAGRLSYEDDVDFGVGLLSHKKVGDSVKKGEALFTVYYRDEKSLKAASEKLSESIRISGEPVKALELIKDEFFGNI
jgi:pyrimidine-nucleoside phosphorylase